MTAIRTDRTENEVGSPIKRRSSARTSVATLFGGSLLAQLLPLALTPLLTHLYNPAAFGQFGVFIAVDNALARVVAGRYDIAVMVPGHEDEALNLSRAALLFTLAVSALVGATCLVLGFAVSASDWGVYLAVLPPLLLLGGFCQTMSFWVTRKQGFRTVALGQLVQMMGYTAGAAALGLMGIQDGRGLALGYLAGQILVSLMYVAATWNDLKEMLFPSCVTGIRSAMKKHRAFPLLNGPHALVDGLRDAAVNIAVVAMFGSAVNGAFTLALRVMRVPMVTLGQSVWQVFLERGSKAQAAGADLGNLARRTVLWVSLSTLPFYLVAWPLLPWLFELVFGEEWRAAGLYAQYLLPWLYLYLVAEVVSCAPLLKGRQQKALWIAVLDVTLRMSSLAVGWWFDSPDVALILMSASGSILTVAQIVWYVRMLSAQDVVSKGDLADV